jgi:hypothetical protein
MLLSLGGLPLPASWKDLAARRTAAARITFTCRPEDEGVIAPPVPAKTVMPDWFKRTKPVDPEHLTATNNGLTIKRCMPFLDALTTGWIIPLAATVRLVVRDGGRTVDAGWEFDRTMVSGHGAHQVPNHPNAPRPPMKFHNHWTVATPPGWSCLFVPPLNRPHPHFEVLAGIVDTDTYRSEIHFPFFATGDEGTYVIERGTPLVQVIPFRRDSAMIDGEVRAARPDEAAVREKILRATGAGEGWYRKEARAAR